MVAKPFTFATTGALAAALLVAAACQNQFQAPEAEGPEGAALNVGLGAAVAPLHRAATGCYTPCAYGTVCDEASGTCVSRECAPDDRSCLQGGPAGAVSIGSAAPAAPASAPAMPLASPICTPACLADQMCVVEAGLAICRAPGGGGPPPPPSAR